VGKVSQGIDDIMPPFIQVFKLMSHKVESSSPPDLHRGETPVLYIHPAKQGIHFRPDANMGRSYGLIPVGLAGLVNLLRENGIPVKGVNYFLERQLNQNFDLKRWLGSHLGVRVILIDLHWYEHSYGAMDVVQLCKQVMPWAWTVLGGLTASGFSQEILEHFRDVDFIIRGDAEKPLLDLVKHLLSAGSRSAAQSGLSLIPNLSYRNDNGIVENAQTYTATTDDLDALNFVDMDFLDHYQEYLVNEYVVKDLNQALSVLRTNPFRGRWLTSARGCRYHCAYCGGGKDAHKRLAGRNGLVTRSPQKLVDDLIKLEKAGVIQASMSYDIAEIGEDYWQEFFSLCRSSGLKIGLYNEFFQAPEPAFIDAFATSVELTHSSVVLSPLSGNERVRRLNGKHFSNLQLFDTLEYLSRYNIYLLVYFSLNLPGENQETFQETLNLARDICDFYPPSFLRILNSAHTIDPFSPMNLSPEKYGIESSMTSFMDFYHYCQDTQYSKPEARTELNRGFRLKDVDARSLERMANAWDEMREGKETIWYPIPPSW
jgi:radical SAM superfamily enzyme YgiQ (UPF0313 family)